MKRAGDKLTGKIILNWKPGAVGAADGMRDTVLTEGCVRTDLMDGNDNGVQFLKVGDTQTFTFSAGDLPPYGVIPAPPKHDTPMTTEQIAQKKRKMAAAAEAKLKARKAAEYKDPTKKKRRLEKEVAAAGREAAAAAAVAATDPAPEPQWIIRGYVGTGKSLKQILAERGAWDPRMTGGQPEAAKRGDVEELPDHLIAGLALAAMPDFAVVKSELQEIIEAAGHIFLPGVKCHPEMAGQGIEYSWGKFKYEYRRRRSQEAGGAANFQSRLEKCLSDEVLGITRIWKFARRARRYMNCYEKIGEHRRACPDKPPEVTWDFIEKLQKDMKQHRCPMEQDGKWIRACT
jgi:hypothetical protein